MNLCIDLWSVVQIPIIEFEQEHTGNIIYISNNHTLMGCRRADFYSSKLRTEGSYVSPTRVEGSYVVFPRHGSRRCIPM